MKTLQSLYVLTLNPKTATTRVATKVELLYFRTHETRRKYRKISRGGEISRNWSKKSPWWVSLNFHEMWMTILLRGKISQNQINNLDEMSFAKLFSRILSRNMNDNFAWRQNFAKSDQQFSRNEIREMFSWIPTFAKYELHGGMERLWIFFTLLQT